MWVKNFEKNGNNISENIVKLMLKQINQLHNHFVCICAEERDF